MAKKGIAKKGRGKGKTDAAAVSSPSHPRAPQCAALQPDVLRRLGAPTAYKCPRSAVLLRIPAAPGCSALLQPFWPTSQGPSKSAFIDLPSPATPATTVGGASTPGVSTPPPYMAGFSPAGAPQTSPANGHAMPAAAASPLAGMGAGAVASPAAVGGPAAASAPGSAAAAAAARPARRRPAPKLRTTQVPLPLAILGGIVMGALVYIWKKRPIYYEVREATAACCDCVRCMKRGCRAAAVPLHAACACPVGRAI